MGSRARQKGVAVNVLAIIALAACRAAPPARYIVTEAPLNVGFAEPLCIAVDPADSHGIWWWEAGRTGCSSRSTGPGLPRADQAMVSAGPRPGIVNAAFRLGLIRAPGSDSPEFVDIQLVLEQSTMRSPQSRVVVPTIRRRDLELPESTPPTRSGPGQD